MHTYMYQNTCFKKSGDGSTVLRDPNPDAVEDCKNYGIVTNEYHTSVKINHLKLFYYMQQCGSITDSFIVRKEISTTEYTLC